MGRSSNRILLRMRGLIWINVRHPMLAIWESLKALWLFQNHCCISNHRPLSTTLKSRLLRWSFHCHFTFNLGSTVVLPRNWLSSVSIAICWSLHCVSTLQFRLAKAWTYSTLWQHYSAVSVYHIPIRSYLLGWCLPCLLASEHFASVCRAETKPRLIS